MHLDLRDIGHQNVFTSVITFKPHNSFGHYYHLFTVEENESQNELAKVA